MAEKETGQESKRDRVRRILINPLLRAGMRKQNKMKADQYSEMLTRLADKLSYLDELHLRGLEPKIIRHAKGKERNEWPAEVSIISWAYEVQSPPPRKCAYVVSVLKSKAGARALEYGYLPELLMALRTFGPPFSKLDLQQLAQTARANRQDLKRVREMIERGTAPLERRQWMDWYLRHEREAKAIMEMDISEGQAA